MPQSNNVVTLIESVNLVISDDFNYSYTNNQPGFYTIIKRSSNDPFKAFTMMQVAMLKDYKFLDQDELMRKICEFVAEKEHSFYKKADNE